MPSPEWSVMGPSDFIWTPAEVAQIARAVQAFREALPNPNGRLYHRVGLDNIKILGSEHKVKWPQPEEPVEPVVHHFANSELEKKLEEAVQQYETGLISAEEMRRSDLLGDR